MLRVGPGRALRTPAMAARVAKDGDTIEFDPGDYVGSDAVAAWDRDTLTLRGTGRDVRMIAAGAAIEGKAIWVVRRGRVTVDGIQFIGARVGDRNGAGIRVESGELTVRGCLFHDNESGILTSDGLANTLHVEDSEFAFNGYGDGQSHGIYAGRIAALAFRAATSTTANEGHLSRAVPRAATSLQTASSTAPRSVDTNGLPNAARPAYGQCRSSRVSARATLWWCRTAPRVSRGHATRWS